MNIEKANEECDKELKEDQAYYRLLDLSQDVQAIADESNKGMIINLFNTLNSLNKLKLDGTFSAHCLGQELSLTYDQAKLINIKLK